MSSTSNSSKIRSHDSIMDCKDVDNLHAQSVKRQRRDDVAEKHPSEIFAMSIISQDSSITKTETFCMNMAKHLVSINGFDKDEQRRIKKMISNRIEGNKLKIHYSLGKEQKEEFGGRFCPDPYYGLATISRDARNALAQDFYWDIDIANAQVEILRQLANRKGWVTTALTQYCMDRDSLFAQFKQEKNMDRDASKRMFISLLFGGCVYDSFPVWVKDVFYPEVKQLITNICNDNPKIYAKRKRYWPNNAAGSACAIVMQTQERQCLMALDRYLSENGRHLDVLIHDGGYVRKLSGHGQTETCFPKELLLGAEKYIEAATGYQLRVVQKDIETTFKLVEEKASEGKSYAQMKELFEKDHFLCVGTSTFYITSDQRIRTKSEAALKVAYRSWHYEKVVDGKVKLTSFLTTWLDDPDRRSYEYCELIIPPNPVPSNTFNLWRGFDVEQIEPRELAEEDAEDLKFVKDHVAKLLCDNDPHFYKYFLDFLAFMFQNPGMRNNVGIYLKAGQGIGKNTFIEFLSDIVGSPYSLVTVKPEIDLFGQFNSSLMNKVLLLIDDLKPAVGAKYGQDICNLITDKYTQIRLMQTDTFQLKNNLHVLLFTNNEYAIKLVADDRKMVLFESKAKRPDAAYFVRLWEIIKKPCIQRAFFDEMMSRELFKYDKNNNKVAIDWIADRPVSDITKRIHAASMDREKSFLIDFLSDRVHGIEDVDYDYKKNYISNDALFTRFLNKAREETTGYGNTKKKFNLLMASYKISGIVPHRDNSSRGWKFDLQLCKEWLSLNGHEEIPS